MQDARLILVPCPPGKRKSCDLLREALARLVDGRPDLWVLEADHADLADQGPLLALDASRDCRAGDVLKARRIKPLATLYLPDLIAARRLLDPGRPITEQWEQLRAGVVEILREEIGKLLSLQQEEAAYFAEMLPVVRRYQKEARIVEQAGPPAAELPTPPGEQRERVVLAANRFRNIFMRCDEITPPAALATGHDIFQDACMCMVYAVQHWERGEGQKAADYLEQASHQAGPLLRHKALADKP